jgi:hypothetical protein
MKTPDYIRTRTPRNSPPEETLGGFHDSLDSFRPELPAPNQSRSQTLTRSTGNPPRNTLADRAVWVVLAIVVVVLIAAAAYVGLR